MKLDRIEVRNFRCFKSFALDAGGESLLIIGPNAGGKTSLLGAIRRALHGGSIGQSDFQDRTAPVELIATVSGIPAAAQGAFANAMDFSSAPPRIRIGLRAVWNPVELEVETTYGFPDDGWRRAGREARENLPLISLSAWRDIARLAPFVGNQSLLDQLVTGLPLQQELAQAVSTMTSASTALANSQPLQQLLVELRDELAEMLPGVGTSAYSMGLDVAEPRDVLRQFELLLGHRGPALPVAAQSGGLTQATVFALVARTLKKQPDALLLVDEPEAALHPHAQRAVVSTLRQLATQSIIATHSSTVLDRVDPRHITRLRRGVSSNDTESVRATGLTEDESRRVSRYATSHTAETYFAEIAILVEGFSDLLAVQVLAAKLGIQLDAAGVSVMSLEGKSLFQHYLKLLGPQGLDLRLRALCDLDAEADWGVRLSAAGIPVVDRASLNAAGVQVCTPDLERELLAPLTEQEVETMVKDDGALGEYQAFAGQPDNRALPVAVTQEKFIKKDKIRWAPLLANLLAPSDVPQPVVNLFGGL